MILIREIQENDVEGLQNLANVPGLYNLQGDDEIMRTKVRVSRDSFDGEVVEKEGTKYIFVAIDTESGDVVGTSMIAGQHGTEESPHFFFEVGTEKKYSKTISTGFIHGVLRLKYMTEGPSEIGGLVVDPGYRNHSAKVGRQVSFARFLYLALNREKFHDKIIAELLPPLDKKGLSPLWEAMGRRFTNMDYWEADKLCQKNKEFILSLFPKVKFYATMLPMEARNAIGKVNKDTEPVYYMLTKIGFKYVDHIDPFDGGPHLWADVEELAPIRKLKKAIFKGTKEIDGGVEGMVCKVQQKPGEFRTSAGKFLIKEGEAWLAASSDSQQLLHHLEVKVGDEVAHMPFY